MAILYPVRKYPDPVLRKACAPVGEITDKVRSLAADMVDTMVAANGIGLAANQVGVSLRLVVVDIGEQNKRTPLILINPDIVQAAGEEVGEEGCLSVPGFYEPVKRAAEVTVRGVDLDGSEKVLRCTGLTARVFQHEIDHLNGILFIDHLSPLKRQLFRKEYLKQAR